jgi:hypothetical protein
MATRAPGVGAQVALLVLVSQGPGTTFSGLLVSDSLAEGLTTRDWIRARGSAPGPPVGARTWFPAGFLVPVWSSRQKVSPA